MSRLLPRQAAGDREAGNGKQAGSGQAVDEATGDWYWRGVHMCTEHASTGLARDPRRWAAGG